MKPLEKGIWIFVGVGALTAILLLAAKSLDPFKTGTVDKKIPLTKTEVRTTNIPASLGVPSTPSRNLPESVNYAKVLRQSHNYLEFARAAIDSAKAGDSEAQFYLGKALRFCSDGGGPYLAYFQKKGQSLTLNQALQNSAQNHRSNSFTQSIYGRCHDLREIGLAEFGDGWDWLEKAANAGQPAAQATVALTTLSQEAFAAASAGAQSADKVANSRSMLLAAVSSKDPEALWIIGEAQGTYDQSFDDKVKNQLAWWLVSCQRGFDCSPDADWIQLDCREDTYCTFGTSGIDYIRNASVANWPDIEQRARDINAKLEAGKWNALGIGS
jgi:hypothetical protein